MCQKAEHAEAVVYCHDDDAVRSKPCAVVAWFRSMPRDKPTAVNPKQHRQTLAAFEPGR